MIPGAGLVASAVISSILSARNQQRGGLRHGAVEGVAVGLAVRRLLGGGARTERQLERQPVGEARRDGAAKRIGRRIGERGIGEGRAFAGAGQDRRQVSLQVELPLRGLGEVGHFADNIETFAVVRIQGFAVAGKVDGEHGIAVIDAMPRPPRRRSAASRLRSEK